MITKLILILLLFNSFFMIQCKDLGRKIMKSYNKKYETDNKVLDSKPSFLGEDLNRKQIQIELQEVTTVKEPTDIQFPQGNSPFIFILQKSGDLILFDRSEKKSRTLHSWKVITDSEEGLLGLTFHPNFPKTPLVYVNYVIDKNGKDFTIIEEDKVEYPSDWGKMKLVEPRTILEVEQPYPNHNGGQIAFGKDGFLYIGLGDGGLRADPEGNGQNLSTLLGSMLRIDPKPDPVTKLPYSIPSDNPFINNKTAKPEIFAYGIRNPWRHSFSPDGKLLLADVGQDKYEEVNIIESGKNYGWSPMEGLHCFQSNCDPSKYESPIYEYGRTEGNSITGGYVYRGNEFPELKDHYVFGDFITGKIWAFALPKEKQKVDKIMALGKWNILISTFGQDESGEIFLSDYQTGKIFKIVKPKQ
ncbi:MAG: PQQ-dependent sugar dehydrogenase [Leptospiraceae bacterium]|nr:PQQ-dependent sugar dehydrogenase [Leptospiraceae bacterium]